MFRKSSNLLNGLLGLVLTVALIITGNSTLVHSEDAIYSKASDWAKVEIESAQEKGVLPSMLKGEDMTKFATREELCELAVLLYEKLDDKTAKIPKENPFTDTSNVQIMKAYALGITTGTTSTTFEPDAITNREQIATMFGRSIQKLYPDIDYSDTNAPSFTDKADISTWALSHVMFLSKEGIIKGDAGKFMPRAITVEQRKEGYGTTTREQAIAITVRIYSKYQEDKVEESKEENPKPITIDIQKYQIREFVKLPDGINGIKLKNGKIYPLMRKEEIEIEKKMNIPVSVVMAPDVQKIYDGFKIVPPPADVDLRKWQTSIKDQSGRNTCVSFAIAAAMEARYRHLDMAKYENIDLSEQYIHHIQKMANIKRDIPSGSAFRENSHAAWGYSGIQYTAYMFMNKHGAPLENFLPYIEGASYEKTNELSDKPRVDPEDEKTTQRVINDFNLGSSRLPLAAIENGEYRITEFKAFKEENLRDLDQYKAVLKAGYEIVFAAEIVGPDPYPNNKVWDPGSISKGFHAMLMVGYDDARSAFIVKNSWDDDDPLENGFTLLSYDFVTKGYVPDAIYITEVNNPPNIGGKTEQLFLGRWNMDHDGWKGILDIYRIPDFFNTNYLNGQADHRIGTYFHSDGKVYRVNGSMKGNKLEFYIDFNKPNLEYGELQGKKFTGYLFGWDHNMLSGTMKDIDKNEYGFYATRENYLDSNTSVSDVGYSGFIGVWEMNHDGWKGKLHIETVDQNLGKITGTYTNGNGKSLPVIGIIYSNKKTIQFSIPFDIDKPQVFSGYRYSHEKGIISGITTFNGIRYGFVANYTNTAELDPINNPSKFAPITLPNKPIIMPKK